MLRTGIILLLPFILGTLSISPSLVDFQEQFSELSQGIEPQLRDYRAENEASRNQVAHRMLDALGNLTVEMRNITRDYWARIESHKSVFPECLERLREEFDSNVRDGEQDIRSMALELGGYLPYDASYRFNPVLSEAQQANSRAIYQTVQTLGGKRFLGSLTDTVDELQNELEFYRNQWQANQERMLEQLDYVQYFLLGVENSIEWWHEYTVRWYLWYMNRLLEFVPYLCIPGVDMRNVRSSDDDGKVAKALELTNAMMNVPGHRIALE